LRAEQSRAEQSRAEQSRAEQSRAEHCKRLVCIVLIAIIGLVIIIMANKWKYDTTTVKIEPEYEYYVSNDKVVEFSIDDATEILWDINNNPQWESIFDEERMAMLKQFHETYDADVTLFLYENVWDWNIDDFPSKYKNEFEENSDWLKLGWHSYDDQNPEDSGITSSEMIESFNRTYREIERFAGKDSWAKELRLHYWYGDEELMMALSEAGIDYIYYPDRDTIGYDFDEKEDELIRQNGSLEKEYNDDSMVYVLTDFRFEDDDRLYDELESVNKDKIVVFTHAWIIKDNLDELEDLGQWAKENNYSLNYFN